MSGLDACSSSRNKQKGCLLRRHLLEQSVSRVGTCMAALPLEQLGRRCPTFRSQAATITEHFIHERDIQSRLGPGETSPFHSGCFVSDSWDSHLS